MKSHVFSGTESTASPVSPRVVGRSPSVVTRSRNRRVLFGALIALSLVAGMVVKWVRSTPPSEDLLTAPVAEGRIEQTVMAMGVLEPARLVSVGAQVSGQVQRLHVALSQRVRAGDLIAEIDSLPQQNALRVSEAALANIRAQRSAREAMLRQAARAFQRQEELLDGEATSRLDYEAAESALRVTEAEIAAIDAHIRQASIEVETARVNLGYTRIHAPIDGVVVAIVTTEGQTVNSLQSAPTIVLLAQLDTMKVKAQISEADVARVQPGQPVYFMMLGDTDTRYDARLRQIEPGPVSMSSGSASPQTSGAIYYNGLFEVPNPDGRLRPSMTVQVHIIVGSADQALRIPASALMRREADGQYRVRVVDTQGHVMERTIRVGLNDKVYAQVLSGLALGEQVVLGEAAPDAGEPTSGLLDSVL